MLTYICKYTPVELLRAFHIHTDMPGQDVPDFAQTEEVIHSSVCSHAKMLVYDLMQDGAAGKNPQLLLTNCCDSIRRVYDCSENLASFRMLLDLPHCTSEHAVELYAQELRRFCRAYEKSCGHSFDRKILLDSWKENASESRITTGEKHIAVLGARPSDNLFHKIEEALPYPVLNLTCGGIRNPPAPPEGLDTASEEELLYAYAEALLKQIPCMRMEDISGRSGLLKQKGLAGIVYHTVRFCDYYSFEYAQIRKKSDLPMLKIESDYTSQSDGQLSTRLQAFGESLEGKRKYTEEAPVENIRRRPVFMQFFRKESPAKPDVSLHEGNIGNAKNIYIGIDSGSTTTEGAAIDDDGRLLASVTLRTGAKAGDAAQRVCDGLRQKLGSEASGRVRKIVATGYGREHIDFADEVKTEITCHARGAHFQNPDARTIIDIGGQDSKVICLDDEGNVTNFVMNDKCAAGTGRFLEMMAHTLEMDMDEMSGKGLTWKKDLTITSTCTVFAESEVVSLIAENSSVNDIVHALDKSVAKKTAFMVKRTRGTGPYMMTGGVARNRGVVRELEKGLDAPVAVLPHPDLNGAIGAALFARENH